MINLIKVKVMEENQIKLFFSDETYCVMDFSYLLQTKTVLTTPLQDRKYFKSCFIDFGALCWKNGLELSAESLYLKAKESSILHPIQNVA